VAQPGPWRIEVCPAKLERAKDGLTIVAQNIVRETSLRNVASFHRDAACGISDIVKRRLIRVWDLRKQFAYHNHYLRGRFRRSFHRKVREL